ncbi:MAG TPA: hypothetical protein VFL63_04985 [Rhodanobacteraceae bacterium]|nr:hypothetical protein [Rhodanobacteraceae bacterium]
MIRSTLVLCLVTVLLGSCARDNQLAVVSSYYNLCLRGTAAAASAINFHTAMDFAYGVIPYNDTKINVYVGSHPDIGGNHRPPSVGSATRKRLVYEGAFGSNQYLYVYGYKIDKVFGDHHVEMPVFIRLQVDDTQRQRAAAALLGDRLVRCPNGLVETAKPVTSGK